MNPETMAVGDIDVVEVSGPDASSYLQGQISQDIDAIGVDKASWSFVLQPSGKVESWFRVLRIGDSTFCMYVESGFGSDLADRLARFLIRTDATINLCEPARVLSIRAAGPVLIDKVGSSDGARAISVDWPEFRGIDLIGDHEQIESTALELGVGSSGASNFERMRISAGVPRLGTDISVGSIPAAAGDAVIAASVSFTKGCYTGQELVARMHSRGGQAPSRLQRLTSEAALDVAAEVTRDGDSVGVVTSAAGPVGIATLTRKVSPGDRVEVSGVPALVTDLPGGALA